MKFKFINISGPFYKEAVDLRIALFFEGMENANALIQDSYKSESFYLICFNEVDEVIGTGRLYLEGKNGIVSQMAVSKEYQRKGVGKEILLRLIKKSNEFNILKLTLSARESAIEFYRLFGFEIQGELYPSVKTGIIHQMMSKEIIN